MLSQKEREEREGLLATIAVILEDRLYDHDLRKLLANVAIDRHMALHTNAPSGSTEVPMVGDKLKQIMSFASCTNTFCQNVNKELREFRKPEFVTNAVVLNSMHEKYQVNFMDHEGAITISLLDRSKANQPLVITPGSEATQ